MNFVLLLSNYFYSKNQVFSYHRPPMMFSEIVEKIINPSDGWFFRADLSQLKCQDFVVRCIQECTAEEPELRPDFKYIRMRLKPMQEGL